MQVIAFAFVVSLLLLPTSAQAYVGPGLGLGAVGMVLAVIFSTFLAIVGIIWYPFKRLIRKFKKTGKQKTKSAAEEPPSQ